jgi:hypothetical protein
MRTTLDIDGPILKKLKAIQARDGRTPPMRYRGAS